MQNICNYRHVNQLLIPQFRLDEFRLRMEFRAFWNQKVIKRRRGAYRHKKHYSH